MDIQIKSKDDRSLLHLTGFFCPPRTENGNCVQPVDTQKLADFCGVSVRTVRHWLRVGLPERARIQLENLHSGAYLPPAWRNAGIRIFNDGIMLRCGNHVSIDTLAFWRFIVCGIDWQRVRDIENTVNSGRRLPVTLTQSGFAALESLRSASVTSIAE